MKIVINSCYGGFSLSDAAYKWLKENGSNGDYSYYNKNRTDPMLVKCVETLGSDTASGSWAELEIKELDISWEVDSYDGMESVTGSVSCY